MTFSIGDTVFVPEVCSIQSMIYYGEHRAELTCPCTWRHNRAVVTRIHGNFVHVADAADPQHKTAFYHKDITLVQRAGAEDGAD